MIKFIKTNEMKIKVLKEQEKNQSSKEKIIKHINDNNIVAFDIYNNKEIIGFAMLKEFDDNSYFLWNYAIDYKYQNKGLGTKSLKELINFMIKEYKMKIMTTTYTYGNNNAKHIYEKVGFKKIDEIVQIVEPSKDEVRVIIMEIKND